MAYINVANWSPDQVTDWMKGLDDSMYHYIKSFTNNEVDGRRLLHIRPYELEQLGMHLNGHQEIVLESVEHLRNFHYNLDKENLQFLALHIATASRNLFNQLKQCKDDAKLETKILFDISRTIGTTKPLIGWLDRSPFQGHPQFKEARKRLLRFGLEMAASAQRDRFVENPVHQIRTTAEKLANLADYIIQDITDPMILQPATLELVTLKKRESELGFKIVPSYHGIHVITDIKFNSPAHNTGKIEDGDEIVQINYQTVVGWQYKKVSEHLRDSPPDVLLTLKKRPRHRKIYGQIYMKPYRLPSKKSSVGYRWGENVPSPRTELPALPEFPLPKVVEKHASSDSDSSCSDILTPTDTKVPNKESRLYLPKPRAVLQRRNTICGDQLSTFENLGNVDFWHKRKNKAENEESPSLRDKSVSFGFGLEISPRPTTCLGIANGKFNDFVGMKGSMPEMQNTEVVVTKNENESTETLKQNDEDEAIESKPGISKVVRFESTAMVEQYPVDQKYTCNIDNTVLETFEPIPYVDDDEAPPTPPKPNERPKSIVSVSPEQELEKPLEITSITREPSSRIPRMTSDTGIIQAFNTVLVERVKRGRLDKSHSTPTYDDSDDDPDTPPAIEPRKEFLHKVPPAPPPRPKKTFPPATSAIVSEISVEINTQPQSQYSMSEVKNRDSNHIESINQSQNSPKNIPASRHFLDERCEELELLTPQRTKNLTLKKKNSILAKRRKISLKHLEISDIQGHLFRRSKDKHGVTYWAKQYFVLVETALYGFRTKESQKADCLIFLPGFTVSLASEVHSKSFAFKVYHSKKTFYLAAESTQAMAQWMDFIKKATVKTSADNNNSNSEQKINELYSETESSEDDLDISSTLSMQATPSPQQNISSLSSVFGKSSGKKTNADETPPTSKNERYNLGFGSLKKFTKQNLLDTFSSHKHSEKKISSDVPVPTAQFKSYRKVPGNAGIQLGTNSGYPSTTALDISPPVVTLSIDQPPKFEAPRKISSASLQPQDSEREHGVWVSPESTHKQKKLRKTPPYNYMHASNPNLVEFDFHTAKTLDFSIPKINAANSWDAHGTIQTFVTLKDLMLQKQKEEAKEMYNTKVCLGMEKNERSLRKKAHKQNNGSEDNYGGSRPVNKIQSRSLPKTPDYAQSFKPDDQDILMTRSKEGQKLRDFGYELISGDDPKDENKLAQPFADKCVLSSTKKKGINWINNEKRQEDDKSSRQGSFKKAKAKINLESFKTSSEKLIQFKYSNNEKESLQFNQKLTEKGQPLKPVSSYLPVTLPHNKKGTHVFNIAAIDGGNSSVKKSNTFNSPEFKENKIEAQRKNSAPEKTSSYFPKLSFSSQKTQKEKKLLGSPSLHRAIFGRNNQAEQLDPELFPATTSYSRSNSSTVSHSSDVTDSMHTTPSTSRSTLLSSSTTSIGGPDYPNMEYPPIFQPETYSLSDPNASMTLLRKRSHNQSK